MAFDIVFRDGSVDFNVVLPEQECPYPVNEYRVKWFVDRIGIYLGQEQTAALWIKNISEINSITDSTTGGSGVIAVPGTLKEAYDIIRPFFFDLTGGLLHNPFILLDGNYNPGSLDGTGKVRVVTALANAIGFNSITPDIDNVTMAREFRGDATVNEKILSSKSSAASLWCGENAFPYIDLTLTNANVINDYYVDEGDLSMNFKNIADGRGFTAVSLTNTFMNNALNDRRIVYFLDANEAVFDSEINVNAYTTQNVKDISPVGIAQRNSTVGAGVKNSDWSGLGINVKTSGTRYGNQFGLNANGSAFETILKTAALTADHIATFQNGTGIVAWLSDTDKTIATAKAANYTAVANDFVLMTTGATDKTVTLPAAASSTNVIIEAKKVDAGVGNLIIDGNGAETIDGLITKTLGSQYSSVTLHCDGTSWHIK